MSLTSNSDSESEAYDVDAVNFQKIENKITKLGYADGKSDGHDAGFENGFKRGYADGLLTGFQLAKYKSFYAAMESKKPENAALIEEHKVYEKLKLPAPMDKVHYRNVQIQPTQELSLEEMSTVQQEYIRQITDNFKLNLPLATVLFVAGR